MVEPYHGCAEAFDIGELAFASNLELSNALSTRFTEPGGNLTVCRPGISPSATRRGDVVTAPALGGAVNRGNHEVCVRFRPLGVASYSSGSPGELVHVVHNGNHCREQRRG